MGSDGKREKQLSVAYDVMLSVCLARLIDYAWINEYMQYERWKPSCVVLNCRVKSDSDYGVASILLRHHLNSLSPCNCLSGFWSGLGLGGVLGHLFGGGGARRTLKAVAAVVLLFLTLAFYSRAFIRSCWSIGAECALVHSCLIPFPPSS